jgi:hypothetical protein
VITIGGAGFSNGGALEAKNGGELSVQDMAGSLGQVSLGAGGALSVDGNYTNDSVLSVPAGATLNLAGNWANSGSISGNQGTVSLEGSWSNGGQIQAAGGSLTLGPGWSGTVNSGVIEAGGGTLTLQGFFTPAAVAALEIGGGEVVDLNGTLDNTNTVLVVDGAVAPWTLSGGTIAGGTVVTTNGASLVVGGSGGTLDGVTVDGTLDVGNSVSGASLTVLDGLTLNGTMLVGNTSGNGYGWGVASFAGSQALGGDGTVVFGNYGAYNGLLEASGGATLVIGPGITVRGQTGWIGQSPWGGSAGGSVASLGTISADVGGGVITIGGAGFSNGGALEAKNGGVIQPTSSATLNAGTITIDSGTMTFANGFTQTNGTLSFGLNSPTDFGQITFSGAATLGGTLAAHLGAGYAPALGDSFAVLNYGNNTPGFTSLSLPPSNVWTNNEANGILTLVAGVQLPVTLTVAPTNSVVPVGSTVTFGVTTTGPLPQGFQWLQNGSAIPGATNATLTLTNLSKSATGAYTVSVNGGSLVSAPVQVLVLAPPQIVAPPQSQTVSVGSAVQLAATVSGDPTLAYQWLFNGSNLAGATNSSLSFGDVTRLEAGSYVLMVSNLVGVATSAPAFLTVVGNTVCPGAPAGMVAWWRGDGDTSDYAGTNDAVFEGTVAFAPGEVGQAFSFDGISSYLLVPDSPRWDFGTNDFSVEFWANFAATNASITAGDGSVAFLAHEELSGARDKWMFGAGGGEIYLYVNGSGVGPRFLAAAPFIPQTNRWYHLGLTKAGAVFSLFEDGAAVSVETNSLPIPVATGPLTIGQAEDFFFFQGLMDEISIYNRALAPAEMLGIYGAGGFGKCERAEPLTLGSPGFNSAARFQVQIVGGPTGATVHVQSSSDLRSWSDVGTVVLGGNPVTFTDPAPRAKQPLFYRAVANP